MISLKKIVQQLDGAGLSAETPSVDAEISSVTTDSREAGPGALFCAVRGTRGDGHAFLPDVECQGAAAALVEEVQSGLSLLQIPVKDGRSAAAVAAGAFYREPWKDLTVLGVTGTNGKTTTAAMLRHLLSTHAAAASIGTLGLVQPDGTVRPGTEGLTTPGPVETSRWLRVLADEGVAAVAMEVSSHALDQARVAAVGFDAVIFTNLSRDHLDYHGSLKEYREAKLRLLGLRKSGAAAVVNADDPAWTSVRSGRVVRFGVEMDAEVRAEELEPIPTGMRFVLRTPDGRAPVQLPLYGLYNVQNALGAAAALWSLWWTTEELAAGLETLPQIPGRLERVAVPEGGPVVIVDYAHTPDALERALRALRPTTPGRLFVVFGAGGDRDRGKRPEMGRVAALGADRVVLTSDNPRTEDPERILDDIEGGLGDVPRVRIADRRDAIRYALDEAEEGDVILLAGKGHETYQIRGEERLPFDERVVVRTILEEKGVGA